MSDGDRKPDSWFETLRRMGDSLLRLAQSRVELFALEFQEERLRALDLFVWLGLVLALGSVGLLLLFGALALFLWQTNGYFGLIGLAVLVLAGAGGVLWFLRRKIERGPRPFAGTVAEFQKDRECLQRKN